MMKFDDYEWHMIEIRYHSDLMKAESMEYEYEWMISQRMYNMNILKIIEDCTY